MSGHRRRSDDGDREAQINAWVRRQLANAPPLTSEQRGLLRRLLRPAGRDNGLEFA